MRTSKSVKLYLLGEFALSIDSEAAKPIRISSKKARALLSYIAMHPKHCVGRDRLASLFWSDRSDRLAYQSLRQCLHSLQSEFAAQSLDLLMLDDHRVGLKIQYWTVDALQLVALSPEKALPAICLYKGEFLANFNLEVEPFSEWVQAERMRLQAVAARAFESCVQHYDVIGDGQQAIDTAVRLVDLDPLREDWHCILLRLYARYRGAQAALAYAKDLTALLRRQLDVDPAPPTRAIIAEIQIGAIAPNTGQAVSSALSQRNELTSPRFLTSKPSIAVLPFVSIGSDPQQEYFADGVTEETILTLSHLHWLTVIARNSSFTYKGKPVDVRLAARTLGARYVLEGSVRVAVNRVRIAVSLIDGMNGHHVWTESFNGEIVSTFAIQDEIAEWVVKAIAPRIYAAERDRARAKPAEGADSWDCVVRALSIMNSRSKSDLAAARKLLNRSIALQPDHVKAYSLLSYVTTLDMVAGWAPRSGTLERALDVGRKAVVLDSEEPWAHLALGFVYAWSGRSEDAVIEYQHALKLDPTLAYGHTLLGAALCYLGRGNEALTQVDKAQSLGPKDLFTRGNRGINNQTRAIAYFVARRYRDGIQYGRSAIVESPTLPTAYRMLIANCALAGEIEEARGRLQALKQFMPSTSLESIKEWLPFGRTVERKNLIDGFRAAGLS
jgi:TolB-like protein